MELESGDLPLSVFANNVHEILVSDAIFCDGNYLISDGIIGLLGRSKRERFEVAAAVVEVEAAVRHAPE